VKLGAVALGTDFGSSSLIADISVNPFQSVVGLLAKGINPLQKLQHTEQKETSGDLHVPSEIRPNNPSREVTTGRSYEGVTTENSNSQRCMEVHLL
jgi:hypothetical protein